MQRDLNPLARETFDVLVIGGGIVGACTARDAALRGLKVALIERDDFAGGISWNSLKILHGGLRSLQGLDIVQARQFVHERRAWLRIAPHLVDPLSFVVPTRGLGKESSLLLRAGLALNDVVSADRNEGISPSRRIPAGRALGRAELERLVPGVFGGYTGGALFHDAQLYSAERLVLAILGDAVRAGAVIGNYVEASAPLVTGGVLAGVVAQDHVGGERFDIRASLIINAAGGGAASLADLLTGKPNVTQRMTGVALNLMLDGDGHSVAFAMTSRDEGKMRRLFVVPWRGRTLVGTAHYAVDRAPQSAVELEPYVERFVAEVAAAWPAREITRARVLLVHAGMQPSPHGAPGTKAHGPPEHLIVNHARDGVPQLITAIGPKLTTSRAIAEQLVDIAAANLGRAVKPCETAKRPLASAPGDDMSRVLARAASTNDLGLPEDVVAHLVRCYGDSTERDAVLASIRSTPAFGERIERGSPVIGAQMYHAAKHEWAARAGDLISRRTELGATARAATNARRIAEAALATA